MIANKTNLSIDLNLLVDENESFLSEIIELLYQSLLELPIEAHNNIENWSRKEYLIKIYRQMKNSAIQFKVYPNVFSCIRFLFYSTLENYIYVSRNIKDYHLIKFQERFQEIANKIPPYIVKEGIPEVLRKLKEQHNLYLVDENILHDPEDIKASLKEINQYFDGFIFSSITDVLKPDIRMFIIKNSNIDGPVIMQKHLDMNHYENQDNDILPIFIQTDSIIEYAKQL